MSPSLHGTSVQREGAAPRRSWPRPRPGGGSVLARPSLGPQARPWTVERSRPVVGLCWASLILCICEIVNQLYVFGGGYQPAAGSQGDTPVQPRPTQAKQQITCPPAKGSCEVYCSGVKPGGQDNLLGKEEAGLPRAASRDRSWAAASGVCQNLFWGGQGKRHQEVSRGL